MSQSAKLKLLRICSVILALIICYLIFCGIVGRKKFYPNTNINGIDVSGMTAEEAALAVSEQFKTEYENVHIDVTLENEVHHVVIEDALNMHVMDAVEKSLQDSHAFWGRGIRFIAALFKEQQYELIPELKNAELLYQSIVQSGLDTSIPLDDKGYEITGDNLIVHKGRGAYVVDRDALVSRMEEIILAGAYDTVLDCPLIYGDVDIEAIYQEIHTEPVNATLDPAKDYAVVEAVKGVSFDLEAAKRMLEEAQDGEQVQIPLQYTDPPMTTEEYRECLFRDRMGTFSTNVSGTSNRKANVELAALHCNDTILLPGEEFSFNNVVGERTVANGFLAAPSYVNGESVDEVGGGICQVSSTLYNACLYANLEIDERHCHPYISAYVGAGFDATVSWGGPDYRFCNDTDFPIKIKASYGDSVVTCTIYGTKTEDFSVKLSSETIGVEEYKVVQEEDDTLEIGEEETKVTGIPAYTVQTYRSVYDGDGNLISSNAESTSHYDRRDEIVLVGTKEPEETEDTEEQPSEGESPEKENPDKPTSTEAPGTTEAPAAAESPQTE